MNKYQIGDVVKYSGNAFPNLTNRIGHVCKEELHGYVPISFPDIGITRDIFAANLELVRSKDIPVEIKDENKEKVISPIECIVPKLRADFNSIIKDSGDRTQYPSGAVRDKRIGKGMVSLIPPHIMRRLAKHYEAGRAKYSDENNHQRAGDNWKKGMLLTDFYDSSMRHIEAWRLGDYEEDHLAAALWNIINLAETERRIQAGKLPKELDNRDINDFDNPRDLYEGKNDA
jgi:hypothetical protein